MSIYKLLDRLSRLSGPFRLLIACVWYGVIFLLTELPAAESTHTGKVIQAIVQPILALFHRGAVPVAVLDATVGWVNFVFRTGSHMFVFGVQGLLVYFYLRPNMTFKWATYLLVVIGIGILGTLDEIHQSHVPGRMPNVVDVVKDCCGALLFIFIATRKHKRYHSKARLATTHV